MELHFQKYGEGYPLIILHGLFGMSDNWVSHARRFAGNFSVYTIDQRNHGKSGWSNVFNYQAMATDLYEFLERESIAEAFVLGHSMGGKTAMTFALEYPEKVNKLIVVDISADAYNNRHNILIDAMLSVELNNKKSRNEVEAALRKTIADERIRHFLLKNLYWKDRATLAWKANLSGIMDNLPEVFKEIVSSSAFLKPSLFIRGGISNYILERHIPGIKRLFPDSNIETIDGASHWLHAEKPEEFYNLVFNFIREDS